MGGGTTRLVEAPWEAARRTQVQWAGQLGHHRGSGQTRRDQTMSYTNSASKHNPWPAGTRDLVGETRRHQPQDPNTSLLSDIT